MQNPTFPIGDNGMIKEAHLFIHDNYYKNPDGTTYGILIGIEENFVDDVALGGSLSNVDIYEQSDGAWSHRLSASSDNPGEIQAIGHSYRIYHQNPSQDWGTGYLRFDITFENEDGKNFYGSRFYDQGQRIIDPGDVLANLPYKDEGIDEDTGPDQNTSGDSASNAEDSDGGDTSNNHIEFDYALYNSNDEKLTQLAVLGEGVDNLDKFTLKVSAEDISTDYDVESADITISFNPQLFNDISASDIKIGDSLPIANAVKIDNTLGNIRIAAASLKNLSGEGGGSGITDVANDFVSITLDFDESEVDKLLRVGEGELSGGGLQFNATINKDETVFSKDYTDSDGQKNKYIESLRDIGGSIKFDGQSVTLYEANVALQQQGEGLVLGTQRVIGSDSKTNLVRSGDTLTASADWLNIGNTKAVGLSYNKITNQNANVVDASFSKTDVNSGTFKDGVFDSTTQESVTLTADIAITGTAGQVVDLSKGIISVTANGKTFENTSKGSKNLITFQGDLNYDGRVSMKDLAYLNAGAARQSLVNVVDGNGDDVIDDATGAVVQVASEATYAKDVDADFNGKIDMADLTVLDQDWGKTLHTGSNEFLGVSNNSGPSISWAELKTQSGTTWSNSSFENQNTLEANTGNFDSSLEGSGLQDVYGSDGAKSTPTNDGGFEDGVNSLDGDFFQ